MLQIISENVYPGHKSAGASPGPQATSECNKFNVIPGIPDGNEGRKSPAGEGAVSTDGRLTDIWAWLGKQSFWENPRVEPTKESSFRKPEWGGTWSP